MMRWILLGIGLLVTLTGVIWILQGTSHLGGSFMSSEPFWAWVGLATLAAGLGILYAGIRLRIRRSRS